MQSTRSSRRCPHPRIFSSFRVPFVYALLSVIANPDLVDSVKDADILVFNLPPMFLKKTCLKLKGNIKPDVLAISMIKGLDHSKKGFHLISQQIKDILNIPDVSVMMGANIAEEVAKEMFSESTIGSNSLEHGYIFKELLSMPYFKVHVISDVESVEFCGAIKNVVAIGAGIIDGLGYGDNTKAAIIRIGLEEAFEFSRAFLPGSRMSTFFESCGIADFIVTCYGGKHRLAGEAFVKTGKPFKELESVVPELRFRKLPGPDTLEAVFKVVQDKKLEKKFPLVTVLHNICFEGGSPSDIIEALQRHDEFPANL
ncbi:glycerol-3-phosphate dehydrogenase 1-like protein isoform X2 [Actinia tenebrosa]|uniref:Glycerol-3-phosphate dehydrogenase [NAD(+)] n=1 Tax=Actinia tenebrosa TaxID=6105 RepID=A0A6P8J2K2_ACTTE|nr:glycerol-3-phosphate dehydrogenase 1-like protein isoform X2 [Actinia tenebrosa]